MEMNIGDLVCRLSDLKLELAQAVEHAQEPLRDYVVSTQYPIEDRFEVWAEWCEKKHHDFKITRADVPVFGQMVEENEPVDYFRHEVFDWKFFLEVLTDDSDEAALLRQKYNVTKTDVMGRLIATNFGSFRMDW